MLLPFFSSSARRQKQVFGLDHVRIAGRPHEHGWRDTCIARWCIALLWARTTALAASDVGMGAMASSHF
jgi:hypothetical protein